jgi:hypothetical protein
MGLGRADPLAGDWMKIGFSTLDCDLGQWIKRVLLERILDATIAGHIPKLAVNHL